jgi:Domain of Unknown Function (DUF1206)
MAELSDEIGRRADQSDWVDHGVRAGLVAYGVVHLLLGWLALQLAFGDSSGTISSKGALHQLAEQPLGLFLLWLVGIGMVLLVLWRLLELIVGHRDEDGAELWRERGADVFRVGVYGVLALSAFSVALGDKGGGAKTDTYSAKLMSLPWGVILVGAVGLGIIGFGVVLVWQGLSEKHAEELAAEGRSGQAGSAYLLLGKVGYVAKGIAIGLVGGLFCYAAVTHDPKKSGGLDTALQEVLRQPFGQVLLSAIGVGLICFGLFCFARARHLSR